MRLLVMPGTYEEDGITITRDIALPGHESGEVVIVPGTGCELDPPTTEQSSYPLICSGDPPLMDDPGGEDDAEIAGLTILSREDGVLGFVAIGGAPTFSKIVPEGVSLIGLGFYRYPPSVYLTAGSAAEIIDSLIGEVLIDEQSPVRVVVNRVGTIEVDTDDRSLSRGAKVEIRGNKLSHVGFAGSMTVADYRRRSRGLARAFA